MPDRPDAVIKNYFVDEAGDPVLFSGGGRTIVGTEGCSKYFILGFLDVADPLLLTEDLGALRKNLLADPYFGRVPSMQPAQRKTAVAFHAKDDLPEVRHQVFRILMKHELRFYAEVRDKLSLSRWVANNNSASQTYHYRQNDIYDQLVTRLFKNHLHKGDEYNICFAGRGKSDRTKALLVAVEAARSNFVKKWPHITSTGAIRLDVRSPKEAACLQAVDYFLWALQRCFERRESRYIEYVWEKVHLVHDIDDQRKSKTGVYYTQSHPLRVSTLNQQTKKEGREI